MLCMYLLYGNSIEKIPDVYNYPGITGPTWTLELAWALFDPVNVRKVRSRLIDTTNSQTSSFIIFLGYT